MNQEKIGKFIASIRKEKNITQNELAEKLGVSDRTIGNWENGRNMPDVSLFKPLCEELGVTLNDLLSGEKVSKNCYQERLEENIISAIDYSNKKIEKNNNIIALAFIILCVLSSFAVISIFPSDSSWGSICSVLSIIFSLIGVAKLTKKINFLKRLLIIFSYFSLVSMMLIAVDFVGVINVKQAPRFSIVKVTGDKVVYYDTLFYDVIRCNVDEKNETFEVVRNQKYDINNIDDFCK